MIKIFFFLIATNVTTISFAAMFRVGTSAGTMLQPTSQYYHAVYGAYADVSDSNMKFLTRLFYFERPEFKSAGFTDKELGGFLLIGTKLTTTKQHGLVAYVGSGQIQGFNKADQDTELLSENRQRKYQLNGISLALEYGGQWAHMDFGLAHHTFTGFKDHEQFSAYVAWPYSFFLIHLGIYI